MHKDVPLTIERLHGKQEAECLVTSARQIHSLLHGVADEGSRAALYYDGAKNFIITSLLGVGEKGFWVEQGMDAAKNRQIAESKRITLVSSHQQVKIQLAAGGVRVVEYQGYPAFYLSFPASLYRIQRREYFRTDIPLAERLHCIVPRKPPEEGAPMELPVMDISVGGVRLSCAEENAGFVLGQTYAGCRIDLPETGRVEAALLVKSVITVSPKPGQTVMRLGCAFLDLDPAASVLLQRYVTRVQRMKAEME